MKAFKPLKPIYIDQMKLSDWKGLLRASVQCFYSSAIVCLSAFISGINQEFIDAYIDDAEILVGKPGIAEKIFNKFKSFSGRSGKYFEVQKAVMEDRLEKAGIKARVILKSGNGTYGEIDYCMEHGFPVIMGAFGIGGLKEHVICAVDKGYKVNDSFGNALTKYTDKKGEGVIYEKGAIEPWIGEDGKLLIMYILPEGF